MKRARKAAIVDSSDSDSNDGEEENSDYEPEIPTKKNPPKKARVIKEPKVPKAKKVTSSKEETKPVKSKSKNNNNECDNISPPKEVKETKTSKEKKKSLGALNDSLYDTDPSWVPADVISRELNLDWDVTNTTCEVRIIVSLLSKILNLFVSFLRQATVSPSWPDTGARPQEAWGQTP